MPVDEMNEFFYQSVITMGGAFQRATDNNKIKDVMDKFSELMKKELNLENKKRS